VHQRLVPAIGPTARVRAIQQPVGERAARVGRVQDLQRRLARIAGQRWNAAIVEARPSARRRLAARVAPVGAPWRPALLDGAVRRGTAPAGGFPVDRARAIDRAGLSLGPRRTLARSGGTRTIEPAATARRRARGSVTIEGPLARGP
jgi:hypothetical protein